MTGNLSKLNELINTANYAKAEFYLYDLIQKDPNDYNLNKNLGMVASIIATPVVDSIRGLLLISKEKYMSSRAGARC